MFLVTTADTAFWKTDQKLLFLGEWCKPPVRRAMWEKLSYEVLPYHWDDREQFHRDFLYLDQFYEDTLAQLADRLNEFHGVRHSLRYWRILVGPWLYLFLTILFDRHQSLLTAEQSGKVRHTIVGKYDEAAWVFRDTVDLHRCVASDEYNQFLFSEIIRWRGKIPFEETQVDQGLYSGVVHQFARKTRLHWRARLMRLAGRCSRWVPDRFNRVVLISVALSPFDQIKLQCDMGQLPYLVPADLLPPLVDPPESTCIPSFRAGLLVQSRGGGFEELATRMIPRQIPTIYLEGYDEMRRRSLRVYPKKPRVIFTSVAYEADEAFKTWAAHNVERGCKLVGSQHGAAYGAAQMFQEEDHQIKICDRYYTWGWSSEKQDHVKPLPAAKFNKVKRVVKPLRNGRILMPTFVWPRYAYRLNSVPLSSSGTMAYLRWQFRFARCLSEPVRTLLLVRPFPNDREWNQLQLWSDACPDVECSQGKDISMFDQMNQSRLIVTLSNGTPALEALAAEFPTILLWDPHLFELRPSAQPFYDDLEQVGVLHASPESAAAKVNEIHRNPGEWWRQSKIQEATNRFCKQFARMSDTWLQEWKTELLDLAKG